jgi:hypothetical protein
MCKVHNVGLRYIKVSYVVLGRIRNFLQGRIRSRWSDPIIRNTVRHIVTDTKTASVVPDRSEQAQRDRDGA